KVTVPELAQLREGFMRPSLIGYLCTWMLLFTVCAPGQDPSIRASTSSQNSPVGQWKTIDDATGKVESLVLIQEENGKLYGRIEKLLAPDPQDPDPRCVHCTGEAKDKPLIGLRILWDLRKDGNQWSGGKVLD